MYASVIVAAEALALMSPRHRSLMGANRVDSAPGAHQMPGRAAGTAHGHLEATLPHRTGIWWLSRRNGSDRRDGLSAGDMLRTMRSRSSSEANSTTILPLRWPSSTLTRVSKHVR